MNNSSDRPIDKKVPLVLTAVLAFALTLGAGQMAWATAFRAPVDLGKATPFVILTKSGITNVPTSAITGNLGVSPIAATAITGFSLILDSTTTFSRSAQVTGKIYAASYASPTPANLTTAVHNMETAYTDAAGRTIPDFTELYAGNLSGRTLAPGLYKWSTGVSVTSAVTLAGPPSAVWIFQIAGNLTMGSGAKVLLSGGAQAGNIFWQVAGGVGVEIGTTSHVEGTILAKKAIHLRTGASLNGRALAQTAVTLEKNIIKIPLFNGVTNPTLGAVTPSTLTSTPATAQTFRAVYSDTEGYASLKNLHFLVNTTANGANAIWLLYDRPANNLYLYNNAGTGFVGKCTPGVAGSLSNSQGTLKCGATTVRGSGNNLAINWNIKPKAAFISATKRNIYLFARNKYNATAGWTDRGDWIIKATNVAPTLGTVTPSVLTSAPGNARKFKAVYSDADGYDNLKQVYFQVSTTAAAANNIRLLYDRTSNKLSLFNDAGTGYVGHCTPGVSRRLSNTKGTLNCAATTATGSGNNLTVNWSITPKAAFAKPTKRNI